MRVLAYVVAAVAAVGIMISIAKLPSQNGAPAADSQQNANVQTASVSSDSSMDAPGTLTLDVPGMHCEFACYPRVKEAIEQVDGVNSVKLAEQREEGVLDNRQVIVQYDAGFDLDAALKLLAEEGYDDSSLVQ